MRKQYNKYIFGRKKKLSTKYCFISYMYIWFEAMYYGQVLDEIYYKTKLAVSNLFRGKFHSKCLNTSFS